MRTPPLSAALRLPELDGVTPIALVDALRLLAARGVTPAPERLALLETARPGRRARWSFLAFDPVDVITEPGPFGDPFEPARRALARLAPDPLAPDPDAPPFAGGLIGYVGYDIGRLLERLPSRALDDDRMPPLHLALVDLVVAFDHRLGHAWLAGRALDGDAARLSARLAALRARLLAVTQARDSGVSSAEDSTLPISAAISRSSTGDAGRAQGSRSDNAAGGTVLISPAISEMPSNHGVSGEPLSLMRSGMSEAAWVERVEALRTAIADGQLYQANLARRLEAPFEGEPWGLYRALRAGEPAPFAAFVDVGAGRAVVSASPEPFLAVDAKGCVATDPIKGTRPRGATRELDRALARELLTSAKDRAENVMIVDVLRNDLGRVCRPGSVRVERLCRLERTPTVQHLVSTVTGELTPGLGPLELLAAAFPGGSITGAPKIRAMELIESLEPVRRGPYTGAIGWIGPDGAMGTSIAIRTFVADGERLLLHVGGGITSRSDPRHEWEETRVKARGPMRAIGAVETIEADVAD